jgi:hypothetical protein
MNIMQHIHVCRCARLGTSAVVWPQVEITLAEFRDQVSKPPKETGFWLPLDRCVTSMKTRTDEAYN